MCDAVYKKSFAALNIVLKLAVARTSAILLNKSVRHDCIFSVTSSIK